MCSRTKAGSVTVDESLQVYIMVRLFHSPRESATVKSILFRSKEFDCSLTCIFSSAELKCFKSRIVNVVNFSLTLDLVEIACAKLTAEAKDKPSPGCRGI